MNTSTPNTETAPPLITEAQVITFLESKVAELRQKSSIEYAYLKVEVGSQVQSFGQTTAPTFTTYCNGGVHLHSGTIDGAIAAQVELVAPQNRIRRLQEQAAKLIDEAAAIGAAK